MPTKKTLMMLLLFIHLQLASHSLVLLAWKIQKECESEKVMVARKCRFCIVNKSRS